MTKPPLPETIGPYRVLRPIARGGTAEVYEVADPASGEHLALKLLMQTGGALARFNREYEAMIRLNHPNIVRVYHYGLHGRLPWLTMEMVEGTPIQVYAKSRGKPGSSERNNEVLRLAHDLALALDHIHARGLVHRDLKSANVLVLPDGRVKLIDFGTAKVAEAWEDITREGQFIGTFAYASPEQITNAPLDHRSDLYSLGVLLFRLATGSMPFAGDSLHTLVRQHVTQPPPHPDKVTPNLPRGLAEIILALLSKRPDDRPASGRQVAEALEAVSGHPLFLPGTLDVNLSGERLVGREAQMAALWRFLDGEGRVGGAPGSEGSAPAAVALVVGPRGSGKRRVMQALEREARARGWRPLGWHVGNGADDLASAFGMLLGELARSFGPSASEEVLDAIEALRRVARSSGVSVAQRLEVLRSAGAALVATRAREDGKPVVLIVRGIDQAGPVGFEALVGLRDALRQREAQVLILADCLELADDPDSLARLRLPEAMRVTLPPMSVRETALLVGALLNRRPPPPAMARQIWSASGGLPTYIEEIVEVMVARGLLRAQSRDANRIEWGLQDDIEVPVPRGARERVADDLAALPVDRRRVLEALALAGGECSARVLAAALQCRADELTLALEDLVHRGWVALEAHPDATQVRWRQRLAEQVVVEQLHPCRRRVLERLLVDEIAKGPAFVAQIALLLEVGRLDEAMRGGLEWAARHLADHRPVTALEVLDLIVPHVEHSAVERRCVAEIYLAQAQALLAARPTDAQTSRSLARAARMGAEQGAAFQAELHLVRARVQRVIGHYPNFRRSLMEAWHLIEHADPSPLGATIASLLGWSNRMTGHVEDAATWHGRARRIAVRFGDRGVRAHADVGVAEWQLSRGLVVEAERTVVGAITTFDALGDTRGLSLALPVWAGALRLQGRFSEALRVLYEQVPAMRESEAPSQYVRLLLATAWVEVDLCRLGRAQECVDELAAILRRGEHLDLRLEADLVWGRILLTSGRLEDADARLKHVRDRGRAASLKVLAESAHAMLGEVQWRLGDRRGAFETFSQAVDSLAKAGELPAAAAACVAQAQSMAEVLDPESIFRPVVAFLEAQPTVILHLERTLARGRWMRAHGRDAAPSFAEARLTLNRIKEGLNDTDKAALRLHPWARLARRRAS